MSGSSKSTLDCPVHTSWASHATQDGLGDPLLFVWLFAIDFNANFARLRLTHSSTSHTASTLFQVFSISRRRALTPHRREPRKLCPCVCLTLGEKFRPPQNIHLSNSPRAMKQIRWQQRKAEEVLLAQPVLDYSLPSMLPGPTLPSQQGVRQGPATGRDDDLLVHAFFSLFL